MVQVPVGGTFFPVVEVAGNHTAVKIANTLGNNSNLIAANYMDPISVMARNNIHNIGMQENILTFNIPPANPALPFFVNSNPWDWWDPADTLGANETNPNIKSQSMAYIDTVMGFFVPRIATELNAAGRDIGLNESAAVEFGLFPNPVSDYLTITNAEELDIEVVTIRDISGKEILTTDWTTTSDQINVSALKSGAYLIEVKSQKGSSVQKFVKE